MVASLCHHSRLSLPCAEHLNPRCSHLASSHANHRARSFPNDLVCTASKTAKWFLNDTTSDNYDVGEVAHGCLTDHTANLAAVQAHIEIGSGFRLQSVDTIASDAEEKFTKNRIVFTPLRAGDSMHQPDIQVLLFRKLSGPPKCGKIACIVTERTKDAFPTVGRMSR